MSFTITTIEAIVLLLLGFAGSWAGLQLPIAANIHDWRHWWKNLEYYKDEQGKSVERKKLRLGAPLNPAKAMAGDKSNPNATHGLLPWLPIPRTFAVIRMLLILLEIGAFWNYFTKVFAVEQGFGSHYDVENIPSNGLFETTWILFGFLIVFEAYAPHLFFEFIHHLRGGWIPAVFQSVVFLNGAAVCVLMWYSYWAPGLMALFLPVFDLYTLYITAHFAYYRNKTAVFQSPRDALHVFAKTAHNFSDLGFAGYDRSNEVNKE